MRTAINATAMGWQSPDMEMVYNVVVKNLDQQIAEAEQKLAECNVVTTMSAGVSLLETIVANSKVGHITDIKV